MLLLLAFKKKHALISHYLYQRIFHRTPRNKQRAAAQPGSRRERHGSRSVTYLTPSLRGPAAPLPTATPRRGRPRPHAQPQAGIPQRAAAAAGAATAPSAPTRPPTRWESDLEAGGVLCPAPRKHGGRGNCSAPASGCWRRRGRLGMELRWRAGWGGYLGRAVLLPRSGQPPNWRVPPAGAAYIRTHTHTRTHAGGARTRRPAAKSARRGREGEGVVPRVRAQPLPGVRARFPGQSARRGVFHARAVRPALTLAIAAEGRGRRARKRRVSGGCRDWVVIATASGDTTSTAPGAGGAARRPCKAHPEPGGCSVCGVVCSDSAGRGMQRLRSAPAVCRDPGAPSRPSGGTASPPVVPRLPAAQGRPLGTQGSATWEAGERWAPRIAVGTGGGPVFLPVCLENEPPFALTEQGLSIA